MSRMVLEPHLLFFVFCVLLACAVWARYRQRFTGCSACSR